MPDAPPDEETETITADRLRDDFRSLGVDRGDELVVHASLSSLGWVEGGADAVVDALVEAVEPSGTIVAPTFTSGIVSEQPFDPATTPSRTGAVTEALRTRPDAVRSTHPTHSVAAIGPAAETLTAEHRHDQSLGADSPLARLADRGGLVLLLGVDNTSNSTIHVAEARADLPFKTGTNEVLVRTETGDVRRVETAQVGCSKGFGALDPVARHAGLYEEGTVGAADARLMAGGELLDLTGSVLADHPGFLLCDYPDCWWCPEARQLLHSPDGTDAER